jgi:heat shock protein HtpX
MPHAHASPGDAAVNQTAWLVQRALLAIALMVGFYVLALAIALSLLWIPYAEWTYAGRIHIKILAVCVGGAFAVLWALVPRLDRFEPPGPRLVEASAPRLFAMVRDVAARTNQGMPSDIYLLNEVNAWVTHRGGVMGIGSRRVMGVGLPLIQTLTTTELKGVIAHEFGHYCAGDVAVGPWIYKTRSAIGRTIAGVRETMLEKPFLWYGRLFLRLTHAVSRRQEFIADSIAAKVTTPQAVASALRRIAVVSPAFSSYLNEEVLPVIRAGFLPPIAAGFDDFLSADRVRSMSEQILSSVESSEHTDPFDTHPSLRDRISALGETAAAQLSKTEGSATDVLGDFEAHANTLSLHAIGNDTAAKLAPLSWDRVGEAVYGEGWRKTAKTYSKWLRQFTADDIPSGTTAYLQLGSGLVGQDEENINGHQQVARAVYVLTAAIACVLIERGWRVVTSPGRPVSLVFRSDEFEPYPALHALVMGSMSAREWKARCAELGIVGKSLGASSESA